MRCQIFPYQFDVNADRNSIGIRRILVCAFVDIIFIWFSVVIQKYRAGRCLRARDFLVTQEPKIGRRNGSAFLWWRALNELNYLCLNWTLIECTCKKIPNGNDFNAKRLLLRIKVCCDGINLILTFRNNKNKNHPEVFCRTSKTTQKLNFNRIFLLTIIFVSFCTLRHRIMFMLYIVLKFPITSKCAKLSADCSSTLRT